MFCKVIAVAGAQVKRDGQVRAKGSPVHHATLGPLEDELFCLVTDLMDWEDYPAPELAALYKWRWDGSETALREAKAPLRGAGPGTGPMLRSCSPDLVRQELAAWAAATGMTRGVVLDAALGAAPARKGRLAGAPVRPRDLSFTAAVRAAPVRDPARP